MSVPKLMHRFGEEKLFSFPYHHNTTKKDNLKKKLEIDQCKQLLDYNM